MNVNPHKERKNDYNVLEHQEVKIGLALGSGSARGLAHIGVIKALEEEQIKIDYIAGTSIGALIGAAYAGGEMDRFEKFLYTVDWKTIASYCDFVFPRKGLLQGQKINQLFDNFLTHKTFEETKIPFVAVATDLVTGEEVILKSGDLIQAVRASISLPGVFQPVQYNGSYLVDGGLVNPVPANVVKAMGADLVIAVDLSRTPAIKNTDKKRLKTIRKKNSGKPAKIKKKKQNGTHSRWVFRKLESKYKSVKQSLSSRKEESPAEEFEEPNIFDVMANSLNIMSYQITQKNLEYYRPDILLQPEISDIGLFDYDEAHDIIEEGYNQTKENIHKIIGLLESMTGKELGSAAQTKNL